MAESNIKNNILTVISGLMCPEGDLRRASEDRRKALEFIDSYALVLIDIMVDHAEAIEERLMASILLKQYIVQYWPMNDKTQPIISKEVKEKIKKFLPAGIGDNNRQMRFSTAHIMAKIAALEYPNNWPDMMTTVEQMLQSPNILLVEGTVQFLHECLPYDIVTHLSPTLFNILYEICGNEQYSSFIRANVISLITIFLVSDLEKNEDPAHEQILNDAGKKFCGLLAFILSQPYSVNSDFHLKSEVIGGAFVHFLYCEKARDINLLILSTLPIIWEILSKCATEYTQIIGNHKPIPRDEMEDEHNPKYFMKLVNNIFVIVQIISTNPWMTEHILVVLSDIVYSIMIFICITPDIEQEFIEDEHSYCADEFNNMVNNSLRTDLKILLANLVQISPQKMLVALSCAINKILVGDYTIKPEDSFNWRINESVMCTIGCVSDIFKSQRTHHDSFNIYIYLRNASVIVTQTTNVILLARCMLVVGRFSCCMSSEQVMEHLSAICIHLRSNQHILRNAAIRALNFHCQRISNLKGNCPQHVSQDMQKQHLQVFVDVFNSLLDSLINIAEYLNPMIFGTTIKNICDITNVRYYPNFLHELVKMDKTLTANFAARLVPFILNTLAKNTRNALIISRCRELIIGLSKNEFCAEYIQSSLMQPLLGIISYPDISVNVERTETQAVGLYILSVIISTAYTDTIKSALFLEGFMLVVNTINSTEDLIISEMGSRCLCMYLWKCSSQITTIDKFSSLETILSVIYRFLEPSRDEMMCKHIDKLIICTLKVFNRQLSTQNEKLIKCMLSKMNFSQSQEVRESFSVVFLHYFYFHNDVITEILNKVPGPDGQSAYNYIVKYIIKFEYINSTYGKYLHILILCKFLETCLLQQTTKSSSTRITDLLGGVSKEESFLSHIFKILVESYLIQNMESHSGFESSDECDRSDELEPGDIVENDSFVDLCDILNDPIKEKDVEIYFTNYMRTFSSHSSFKNLSDMLTEDSKEKLYIYLRDNVQYY